MERAQRGSGRGSGRASLYDQLIAALPDERFVFMNHGYLERGDDPSTLGVDETAMYAANLVRRLVRDTALDGATVLDVGCGRGGASAWLARNTPCRRVVGLDHNAGNVAFCRRVHTDVKLVYVRGDAHDLPFADGSAEVVFNLESSHCYPDLTRFFAEVRRVLRPGGSFCYADALDRISGGSSVAARTSLLEQSGFRVVEATDISTPVAAALFAGFEAQARVFYDAIARHPSQAAFLLRTLKQVTLAPFASYLSGKAQYGLWRLRRA